MVRLLLAVLLPLAASGEVTFTRDVAPILYKHCAGCHHANDIAPMPLITYNDARPWAAAIKEAVISRKMPPWKADPHYGKWSNDSTLTETEIATIRSWADGGKPEGDPKLLPPSPHSEDGWKIGKPDAVISIPKQKIEGTGPDQYVYITVPSNFKEDRWVVAAELRAGNRRIVHHAHVFVVDHEPATKPAAAATPSLDPTEAYDRYLMVHEGSLSWIRPDAPVVNDGCAVDDNGLMPGKKSKDLGNLISSFLPGREPDVYPEGTARLVKAGSSLNFQIHYSHTTGKTEFDETSVGFIFAKEPPRKIARRIDLSNQMFRVPANADEQEVTECHTFSKDMFITSLTPHMHLRGKAIQMIVTYPDGRRETLLSVPHYDFNWQITYRAAQPIFIPKGTRIAVLGHFDNSRNNPMNPDPSTPVRWGSASETEMMDGWIEYVDADSPEQRAPSGYNHLLAESQQALVVTTPDWNSVSGTLRRFESLAGQWRQVGDKIPVVVGKNGLAWDALIVPPVGGEEPVKHEGDGRSPAGVFPVAEEFGFGEAGLSHLLEYVPLTDQTECVDDVRSQFYNEVVNRSAIAQPDWTSSEMMREVGGYRIGAVVGYNGGQKAGSGSCIFLHVWSGPDHGTAGCTAMDEAGLRAILESLDEKKRPVLIQMPEANYESVRKAWRLP